MTGNLQGHQKLGVAAFLELVQATRAHADRLGERFQALLVGIADLLQLAAGVWLVFSFGHVICVSFGMFLGSQFRDRPA